MDEAATNLNNQFEVIVTMRGNRYILRTREWPLIVEGTDVKEAFDSLRAKRDAIINKYKEAGLEHELPPGSYATSSKRAGITSHSRVSVSSSITLGAICLGVFIGLFGLFSVAFLSQRLTNVASQILPNLAMPSPAMVGRATIDAIVHIAETVKQLTPERKAELLRSIKTIVHETQPVVQEISPLLTTLYPPAACSQLPNTFQRRASLPTNRSDDHARVPAH